MALTLWLSAFGVGMMPPFTALHSQACVPGFSCTSVEVQYQQSASKLIGCPPHLFMMGLMVLAALCSNRCSVRFKKGYRNIIVLKKMTFPNDKVLSIELSEKQISGRTISMNLDYEDVLAADAFDTLLLREQ